jgi:hypothetical protein
MNTSDTNYWDLIYLERIGMKERIMQLNVKRIDERIYKLQEIKRIAADPEMLRILLEFIMDDEVREPAADSAGAVGKPHYEDITKMANAGNQTDEQPRGLWGRKRD